MIKFRRHRNGDAGVTSIRVCLCVHRNLYSYRCAFVGRRVVVVVVLLSAVLIAIKLAPRGWVPKNIVIDWTDGVHYLCVAYKLNRLAGA